MSTRQDTELKSFSERLRGARERAGLTQLAACAAIGATPSQWSNWERGKATPYLDDLVRVVSILGVSAHWLLVGEGPRDIEQLRLADAATPGVSARALSEALANMSAEQIQRIADERRNEELAAWNEPIERAIAALREALGANPPLPVRDEISRSIERMRGDLRGEPPKGSSKTDSKAGKEKDA